MNDDDDEAMRAMERLRPAFEALLGKEGFAEMLALSSQSSAMLDTPHTWNATLETVLARRLTGLSSDDVAERMRPHLPALLAMGRELQMQGLKRFQCLVDCSQPAQALVALILEASIRSGGDAVLAVMPPQVALTAFQGAYTGLGELLSRESGGQANVTFEERTGKFAGHIAHVIERFYVPLLVAARHVTGLATARPVNPPAEVGKLISQLRDAWSRQRPECLPLLDDRARILRNSEAHRRTEIDVSRETITFVNLSTSKGRELIGPLDSEAFGLLVRELLDLFFTIDAAFRVAHARVSAGAA